MKVIYSLCFLLLVILSGCVHQKDVKNNHKPVIIEESEPVFEDPVQEINSNLLTKRIEYTHNDLLNEYTIYVYNDDEQLIQETLYSKKGNVKETRLFEYAAGKLSKQLIKDKKNILEETREYIYADTLLVEKNVWRSDNSIAGKHTYTYKDGLLERENIVHYKKDGSVSDEYYYLYFYDGTYLSRREQYKKNKCTEIRKYIYDNSKLIKEEEADKEGTVTKYFIYKYGSDGENFNPLSGSVLYEEIFSDDVFHEFIVEISREEWDGITQDMLEYAKKHPVTLLYTGDGRPYRTGNYRKADFIYRRPDGEEIVIKEIGIRTRGNESRRLPEQNGRYQKTHFKIKFDETFDMDKNTSEYKNRNNRRFAGMKALNFKWSRYNTYDKYANKNKINELFSYELLARAGVTVPKMSLATLTFRINGKEVDYGIYGIVEHVDTEFLRKRFGKDNDGDLYKCLYLDSGPHLTPETLRGKNMGVKDFDTNYRPIYDLKTNTKTGDHSNLKDFVKKLNAAQGQDFIDYIEKHFEVNKFLKFLAMGIYINNLDDYRFLANNYYLYFKDNGKVDFIPYDFDISLGCAWHGEMNYKKFINQDIFNTVSIPESWGDYTKRPLVDKLLAVEKYKERYIYYLKYYINPAHELFVFSEYKKKFEKLSTLYKGKDVNDTIDKDPMGWQGFEADYFHDKTKNVLEQLNIPYDGYEVE
ncbi:MAG: CotH kinase family protein [Spirochaetales bacterium]|nr:CotH kinase family protein [Spirochaetales bacterium]